MHKSLKTISLIALLTATTQAFSLNMGPGHFLFEAGAFSSSQGSTQKINIKGLVGDRFRVTDGQDSNALFGLGYLIDGPDWERFNIAYGINAFYLLNTRVSGTIAQELRFTNLAYRYQVRHLPVYAAAKASINTGSELFALTLDAGIGPNFMQTSGYRDWSIDHGRTIPDHAFSGQSQVSFSAMAGIGLKLNNILGNTPVECGYRFFFLGSGELKARTSQIRNSLDTGNNYAQALVCTLTV